MISTFRTPSFKTLDHQLTMLRNCVLLMWGHRRCTEEVSGFLLCSGNGRAKMPLDIGKTVQSLSPWRNAKVLIRFEVGEQDSRPIAVVNCSLLRSISLSVEKCSALGNITILNILFMGRSLSSDIAGKHWLLYDDVQYNINSSPHCWVWWCSQTRKQWYVSPCRAKQLTEKSNAPSMLYCSP